VGDRTICVLCGKPIKTLNETGRENREWPVKIESGTLYENESGYIDWNANGGHEGFAHESCWKKAKGGR